MTEQPVEEVVEELKALLRQARAGEIQAIAAVVIGPHGQCATVVHSAPDVLGLTIAGGVATLAYEIQARARLRGE